ncbi:hypothetical protein [Pelagibius marinus]|uniref:hypothetical protein n=1 Tax=Pelagibius marinus TaxID=2762760 RepID=UPI001872CB24|nr:hypothetical protein [Pelagibius marinus]
MNIMINPCGCRCPVPALKLPGDRIQLSAEHSASGDGPSKISRRSAAAKPDQHAGAKAIRQDILVCLPEHLHPVSQMFLENWLAGEMTTAEFLRWFHMPNSAYLPVAKCVLAVVAGA